ncbi:hypothetical protein [Adhaeretor mobilis]|uniref:Uncharacterized protein n=1 Tax=Adhaeretor mobilis TaxID=1930276 RepID=A0A517N0S7_9BACT|nr:hypothetical protein [Adhaeretor mobilis]QDT00742.1 hypothetical protein HG15A2_40820 [Adhaeretor mobilis]
MRKFHKEELIVSGMVLLLAGISPNIFPAAQAGLATMPVLALWLLLPASLALAIVTCLASWRGHRRLSNRILSGAAAGIVATLALEAVRATSFHVFEGMPGDLPRLLGVLMTDRFMLGPSLLSDVLGWTYHFWNGAAFGIIFAVLFGRGSLRSAVIYGELIGVGFLLSPAVNSLGVGFMGLDMPKMPITVALAHLAYGIILGILCRRWIRHGGWLLHASLDSKRSSDTARHAQSQPPQITANNRTCEVAHAVDR